MDFTWKIILVVIISSIVLPNLLSQNPSLLCRIIGHKKFINNNFNEVGHIGKDTLECHRCWKLLKVLDYPE